MSNSASSQESYHDLPFDFCIRDDDLDQRSATVDQAAEVVDCDADSYDDGIHWGHHGDDDSFSCRNSKLMESPDRSSGEQCHDAADDNDLFSSSMNEPADHDLLDIHALNNAFDAPILLPEVAQQISSSVVRHAEQEHAVASISASGQTQLSEQTTSFIAHKGTLKRILNPQNNTDAQKGDSSLWPVYAITISIEPQTTTSCGINKNSNASYQILYSRTQYEQCIKLFTLLDTECKSSLGPGCIRRFVLRYCPVIRKRDDALFALLNKENQKDIVGSTTKQSTSLQSPTFDEIWNTILHSDTCYHPKNVNNTRLGLESFMLFVRLLSLTSHLESRRRFSSRHLQQMMRHKHSSSSSRSNNNNEVVVVIDNPPAGPPLPISIKVLMEIELELGKEEKLLKDWPYGCLPMVELDLDHGVKFHVDGRCCENRRVVTIEPFSTASDGDFILRYSDTTQSNGSNTTVVRRSYDDFCWLNETLVGQKKPGHGNLCGRILPPFPPRTGSSSAGGVQYNHTTRKDVSERAVAAAKSSVGMIASVAKSLWGNYIAPSSAALKSSSSVSPEAKARSWGGLSTTRDQNAPALLAKRMDRYLNYMLENSALSTSFPLDALLTASQSGLECSKQILQDYAKQKKRSRSTQSFAASGSASSALAILSTLLAKKPSSYFNLSDGDDSPWLRTAARTAMSLQFHGILETTGHESTSAKIQHASLPKFGVSAWDEEESENAKGLDKPKRTQHVSTDGDFEEGVIRIESELAGEDDIEGYDLLPSPGPSEEHHVLNATNNVHSASEQGCPSPARVRFVYGASNNPSSDSLEMLYENAREAVNLGSVKVDSDIDKLKSIIKSVDHILKRLYKSSMIIQSAQTTRNALQLDLLKDIDSFGDSRGGVINQRSLVDGVAALSSSNATIDMSNGNITDDFGWQSALASSAVGATREVKEAVLASRTASRAKNAAFTAAAKSKKAYESLDSSSSRDEINAAQSEASSTQSHAIHATVVEYEANMAKKRAAVSLAQDVKSWNAYRKRNLHQTSIEYAKSQREACRRAALAWECLRDGLIDLSGPLFAPGELDIPELTQMRCTDNVLISSSAECSLPERSNRLSLGESVGHNSLGVNNESRLADMYSEHEQMNKQENDPSTSLPEAFVDVTELTASAFELDDSEDNVYLLRPPDMSNLDEDHYALHQDIISAAESSSQDEDEAIDTCAFQHDDLGIESVLDQKGEDADNCTSDPIGENMTMSMQSLIDGLMAWGGEEEPVNDIGYQSDGLGRGLKRSSLLE